MKFEDLRKLALALPEVAEAPHHHLLSFRVEGKIFATVPPERTHAHIFVDEHASRAWADQDPATYEALMWGKKLAGLRVALATAKPADVSALLRESWERKAPRKLLTAKQRAPKAKR